VATAPGRGPRIDVVQPPGPAHPPQSEPAPEPLRVPATPPAPHGVAAADGAWCVRGTVRFEGEVPEPGQIDTTAVKECAAQHPGGLFDDSLLVAAGRLANVVVWVKPGPGQELPAPPPSATPAVLDQKGCRYLPHVLAVQVGQPVVVKNSDPFLHNVHALSFNNPPFNFGQPTRDPVGRTVGPLKVAEVFRIKCDVHPWMSAYVHVVDHPYFAVSGEDGTFKIPGTLPDGAYTLVAWHEKLGEKQIEVTVTGGRAEGAEFAFAMPAD
jgi:hypothetical protein